ncbi:thioesterase [Actinopolyspora mortivallis]|uniref:Thioesterase n=1 Tax=Actinopolyspora mortivallis TaxID=33906 RepID=A0A2T0H0P8_ACTMO|nr:thioesterase [Actinopolyspora mortivallis]PRW64935.1 thioesterase [Actinopolyspora mortivallis]
MSSTAELGDVLRALAQLRTGVDELYARYGDTPVVRRVENDLQRLEIDVSELSTVAPGPPPQRSRGGRDTARGGGAEGRPPGEQEIVEVPDTPYVPSWWRGVDDEGVGGQSARQD